MAATVETQHRSAEALGAKIRGIELSRNRLERTFDTLGTGEYDGRGGSTLNLDSLSGEPRIDAAIKVGTAKKRIREVLLPHLAAVEKETRASIKVEQIRELVEQGYLPETELERVAFYSERELELIGRTPPLTSPAFAEHSNQTVSSAKSSEQPRPLLSNAESGLGEENDTLSDINIDEREGLVIIDGRTIKFRAPRTNIQFKLFAYMLRNRDKDFLPRELDDRLADMSAISPATTTIYQLKTKIELDPREPKILVASRNGQDGTSYRIRANSVNFASLAPQNAEDFEANTGPNNLDRGSNAPTEIDEGEALPIMEVSRKDQAISVNGRKIVFSNNNSKFSWSLFLHMASGDEFYRTDLEDFLKGLGSPDPLIAQYIFDFRQKLEQDPANPKIFRSRRLGRGGAFYKMHADVRFVDDNPDVSESNLSASSIREHLQPTSIDSDRSTEVDARAAEGRLGVVSTIQNNDAREAIEAISEWGSDEFSHPHSPLDEPSARTMRALTGQERMSEIDLSRQEELKINLALTLLSYLSANDPGIQITDDPVGLIHTRLSGISLEQQGSIKVDEKLKRLTGVTTNDELRRFFVDSFTEVLEELWEGDPKEREISGTRELQVAQYCRTLAGKNVRIEEVIREVCRHFKLSVPAKYEGPFLSPHIRLYSDKPSETGKQRRRQPSHGKIRL